MAVSPQGIKQRIISSGSVTYIILASRLVLFLLFQSLIALLLGSWETSEKHWLLTATLANIVSMALLFFLFRLEYKAVLPVEEKGV